MNKISVITVGEGRGFIIEHRSNGLRRKLVLTASHCLPHPPVMPCYSYQEATYRNLLAPLGEEPSVWAECLFFDPVSDIAILGEPDNQEFGEESDAYNRLVDCKPFTIAAPETGEGYVLTLDEVWQSTPLNIYGTGFRTALWTGAAFPGQSGSPIVDAKGRAVGLLSAGSEMDSPHGNAGPQPILKIALPNWVLRRKVRA